MSGRRQMTLAQQDQHVCGSNLRYPIGKVILACRLIGLSEQSGRAGQIALGQLQASEKHLTDNESVNHAIILPRQLEALSPVLLSRSEVIPFVVYACEAKMRIVDNLK